MTQAPHRSRHTRSRIYLVRHGETAFNAAGRIRGCSDVGLNARGDAQARALATMLGGRHIQRVVTGPLLRARQTAGRIALAAGTNAEVVAGLLDRDYGPWNGWPLAEVRALFGRTDRAPGIEPYAAFAARIHEAWLGILATLGLGENLVIVAHNAVNAALLRGLFPAYPSPRGR
ncbi:MAG TPA: histidine phosphatase family protein, partial [Nevskiaceae bacterium]